MAQTRLLLNETGFNDRIQPVTWCSFRGGASVTTSGSVECELISDSASVIFTTLPGQRCGAPVTVRSKFSPVDSGTDGLSLADVSVNRVQKRARLWQTVLAPPSGG